MTPLSPSSASAEQCFSGYVLMVLPGAHLANCRRPAWCLFAEQDAVSALKRISSRQPAGLGLMGTKIAYDTFSRAGGSLAVTATETGTVVYITLPLER